MTNIKYIKILTFIKYKGHLKNFEPQHEDSVIRQNHSGTTIVHFARYL